MVWNLQCIDVLFQSSQVLFSTKILNLPCGPRFIAAIIVLVHISDVRLQGLQAPGKSKRATWATSPALRLESGPGWLAVLKGEEPLGNVEYYHC